MFCCLKTTTLVCIKLWRHCRRVSAGAFSVKSGEFSATAPSVVTSITDRDRTRRALDLLAEVLGNWWNDDRRHWCAYCRIRMRLRAEKGKPIPDTKSTRDHVIPRKHKGGLITIPACRACNVAKGVLSLQEFLLSAHFVKVRKHSHKNQWPLDPSLARCSCGIVEEIDCARRVRSQSLS